MTAKITDQDYLTATANGDGTYSGVKAVQWLFEVTTGKPLSEPEARALIAEAQQKAKNRVRPAGDRE